MNIIDNHFNDDPLEQTTNGADNDHEGSSESENSAEDISVFLSVNEAQPAPRRFSRVTIMPVQWCKGAPYAHFKTLSAEPRTVKDALTGDLKDMWTGAMDTEIQALYENNVWTLVPRPSEKHVISCKWIFKVREEQKPVAGLGVRYKARLVARGFSKVEKVYFQATYDPVVKFISVHIILAIVAHQNLHLHQMDVVTAILYGRLNKEVYMEQSESYEKGDKKEILCRLKRSLYGLKQALR